MKNPPDRGMGSPTRATTDGLLVFRGRGAGGLAFVDYVNSEGLGRGHGPKATLSAGGR